MTQFALAAQIRNVLVCTVATLTLAACGGESGSSSTAGTSAAADATSALVQPNVGMIDRSQGIDESAGTSSAATVASNGTTTTPASGTSGGTGTVGTTGTATTPASGTSSGTSGTGTGTVATTNKSTAPVKTTNGVATLDWMPPTQNSDGTVLTNLAGYTVYYGTSANDLSQSVKVSNPGLTAYSITGLASGTWYFAVTSYSADGVESTRTSAVSTTI